MANGKRSHRRDGEVTVPWAQHLQLHFLILLQAAQENDLRASRATVPMLRGTTPRSARPVPLPLSVPEHTLAPCSGTGSQTCSLQGKQPGSNPAPAQSQRPPQVPAVPSPTAWGPEAQRGARHTAALLGGRPHLVPLDYARPRGKREVPKSTEGFVCSFGMQQQGQGAGQVFQPATYWDDLQTDATASTSTLQGSPPALGTPSPPCLTCCLVSSQCSPAAAQHGLIICSGAVSQHQKLPLRREAASPRLGSQALKCSSDDIFEILGQRVPFRARAVSPHQTPQPMAISIPECLLSSPFCSWVCRTLGTPDTREMHVHHPDANNLVHTPKSQPT